VTALTTPARHVAVVGGYEADEHAIAMAEEVGRLLAQRGCMVVTGGRQGVAEAACRGAALAGGTTVGILPGRARDEANPYVTVAVPTGLGETRNALVVMGVDAVIALPGAYGTLTEVAHALLAGTRVVGLGEGWSISGVIAARDPIDAVTQALQ
jgi:uncharacterized protein (TIGR00725 family)